MNNYEKREPVAWRYALDASVEGPRWIYIDKDPHQWLQGPAMVNMAIEELHTSPQPSKPWVGLTDEEIDALSQARSLTDELMDCVDRLGSEADTVDPRVWQHLLVYAPKPEEEPVAWRLRSGTWFNREVHWRYIDTLDGAEGLRGLQPLYTAPPKQWVGLTDEEIQDLSYLSQKIDEGNSPWFDRWGFARAIEAKLKEKNT